MSGLNKLKIQSISLLVIFVGLLFLVIALFFPYGEPLFWAAILYILILPLYNKVVGKLNKEKKGFDFKRRLIAFAFAIFSILIVGAIATLIVILAVGQLRDIGDLLTGFLKQINDAGSESVFAKLSDSVYSLSQKTIDLRKIDFQSKIFELLSQYSNNMVGFAKYVITNTGHFLISVVFACFALYFFYVDGKYLAGLFAKSVPIRGTDMNKIMIKFKDTTTSLFKGFFLVALYQAITAFIIFVAFQVKGSLILSILIFFTSFIPLLGGGAVWVPVAIVMFFTKSIVRAVLFTVVAGLGISTMDNLLRPMFLKDTIKVHPLLIFFSLIGGVNLLGLKGLILGPMILIIFFTVIDIVLDPDIKTDILSDDNAV